MSVFTRFPNLPEPEEIALCVVNGVYCCARADFGNIGTFTNATKNHPAINVTRDLHHTRITDEGVSLYLQVEDSLLKRITSVWYKQGFIDALGVAADPTINHDSPVLATLASYTLKIANTLTSFRHLLQPHLKDIGPKIIAKYSRCRNWNSSLIRCIAWHPHASKIAVATGDDNVRVYASDLQFTSTLKCSSQSNVCVLAWRPLSASEIAIACEVGVIVWTVDPNSMFSKPSSSNAVVLKRSGHSPVTDVSWSPNGDLLVSCSGADASMLVWDVSLETAVPLRRVAGGGVVLARWAFDASKLFSASSSIIFRVWETKNWSAERWCTRGGRVSAACWSPQGSLLFVAEGEPMLYALNLKTSFPGNENNKAQPVLDLTKVQVNNGDVVGGPVLDMCWDPTGRYLAMLFHESPVVAIFSTEHMLMQIQIIPCCLVSGIGEEVPCTMTFQQNFTSGACLTIAWSSGRIQHFPIVYTDAY